MAAGKDGSREISPGDFDQVEAGDRFLVIIKQDTTQPCKVIIRGGKNVIENVRVSVKSGKLGIEDRNICNWTRDFSKKITVEVYCKALHGLLINDACEVKTESEIVSDSIVINQKSTGKVDVQLNAGKAEVNHEGLGEVALKGYAAIFVPVMFDAGKLDARELTGDYTFSYHYGINELHVKPHKALFAFIGNTGGTFYYEDPIETPLQVTRAGSGKIEKR